VVRRRRGATRAVVLSAALGLALGAGAGHANAQEDRSGGDDDRAPAPAIDEPSDDGDAGSFVDASGRPQPFRLTYEAWFGPERRAPRYDRAALEVVGIMALGTAYYWADPLANSEDWDDPRVIDKLLGRQARFDTNLNTTNHLLHPGAGAMVYGFSRVNGLSVPAAFAYSAAASFAWEFLLEWREQASINDLVFTIAGGMPLGEFFVKLGDYVNSAPGGGRLGHRIAARSLGLPRFVHAAIDDEALPPEIGTDSLGFSGAFGHAFRIAYQPALLSNDRGAEGVLHRAVLGAEIVAMPGFLRPGSFSQSFTDANFTDLHVRLGWGDHGTDEVDIESKVTLAGHYSQSFAATEGGPRGHAAMIGVGPGWRFHATKLLGRPDQLSTVHLLGPHAELWLASGPLHARLGGEAHVDFGALRSLAYDAAREAHPEESLKSVLVRQGYAYHFGWSARARSAVGVGPLEIGAELGYGAYDSIDALDRNQEELVRDVHGTEHVLEKGGYVTLRPTSVLELGVAATERARRSTLGYVATSRWDRALIASVGIAF
jgi:hypothetical protein